MIPTSKFPFGRSARLGIGKSGTSAALRNAKHQSQNTQTVKESNSIKQASICFLNKFLKYTEGQGMSNLEMPRDVQFLTQPLAGLQTHGMPRKAPHTACTNRKPMPNRKTKVAKVAFAKQVTNRTHLSGFSARLRRSERTSIELGVKRRMEDRQEGAQKKT